MTPTRLFPVAVAALLATSPAAAQDQVEKTYKFTGDFSLVNTGGNSDLVSVGLSDKFEWKAAPRFTLKQRFGWVYGEADGDQSANQVLLGVRGEYSLTARLFLLAGANYDYDIFAGIKRRFEEYGGLGLQAVDAPRDKLRFDVGVSFFQEWEVGEDEASTFTAGKLVGDYKHLFSEKAYIQQIVEFLPNFTHSEDYRLASETALVAPISGAVAVKAGYLVRYRGDPPDGIETTDTTLRTGIQVTF
jgi:putative salt-induced outer membrane protein YdiY